MLANGLLCWRFRTELRTLWREPVLREPVLVFESDDWGAGPLEQAAALERLRTLLAGHRDAHGRHPVMTLGITLASPQPHGEACAAQRYERRFLDHPEQAAVLAEMRAGIDQGVFAAQLHGMEHFMPELLCAEAKRDTAIEEWLLHGGRYSEELPDRLQSRWIDARRLPSVALASELIDAAVAAEVREFGRVFGTTPAVVVPPTFIWTREVEEAWARCGLRVLISCGTRFIARDAAGKPISDGSRYRNGDRSSGLLCLVRDAYFEPVKGHRGASVPAMLERYVRCARPLLLETHRSNFVSLNPHAEQAFVELEQAIRQTLARFPTLRFVSSLELGEAIDTHDPAWIDGTFEGKLCAWAARCAELRPFQRYARLTGLTPLLRLLEKTRPTGPPLSRG